MSRIPVRFIVPILTFVLGVTLAWGLSARRQAAFDAKNNISAHSETPKDKTTAPAIPDNISEDERKEWYGYGADGIKCRVSFGANAWVPRNSVVLDVEIENTTNKDIVIPSTFDFEIMSKDVPRREYARSRQWFLSHGWFEIVKGELTMFPGYPFSSEREYDRSKRLSFVLHPGEIKRLESDISHFAWTDFLSSALNGDDHFPDIVPPGEYEFLMRITDPKWIIVSNRTDIRVE